MSNNKQSMKLYTEEQLHSTMLLALGRHGIYIPNKHYQDLIDLLTPIDEDLIDLLTPIELPSDEEIHDKSIKYYTNITASFYFELGAKWMRDLIQGGDK